MSHWMLARIGVGTWSMVLTATLAAIAGFQDASGRRVATRQVRLDSAYGTTGQKELKKLDHGFLPTRDGEKKYIEPYGFHLDRIRSEFRSGASNLFLVRAGDITEAIRGTFDVVVGGETAAGPVRANEDPKRTGGLWLVAYLGLAGSSPPQWTVRSVEWRGATLRLSYVTGEARTRDMHPYWVWVPLGELKSGTYLLELFDAAERETTLIRRVNVPRD